MPVRGSLTVIGVLLALLLTFAGPGHAAGGPVLYYLCLGTSLSVGIQPNTSGVNVATTQGYCDQLHASLAVAIPKLTLVKFGCPGETTATMITGGLCTYSQGSQLAQATAFLNAHSAAVALVSIDLGANDLLPCATGGTIDQACVVQGFSNVAANLPFILLQLRNAAGPAVPILGMNYYNSFVVAWLQPSLGGPALALQSADLLSAFNSLLGDIYGSFTMPVADVETAFQADNFQPIPGSGGVPLNVALVCAWTWMCAAPPQGPNIHPNVAGYGVIAAAFVAVLP